MDDEIKRLREDNAELKEQNRTLSKRYADLLQQFGEAVEEEVTVSLDFSDLVRSQQQKQNPPSNQKEGLP